MPCVRNRRPAAPYSFTGHDISSNNWRELRVPVAKKLESAVLQLKGRLAIGGAACVCVVNL
ncbi:hypothetical protein L484_016794 [Morus notabilis]|uniref:Uncharacterized protein n=1 Tax=Morus notabilis TaxID=981085 RepID=W9ST98_9ROSA|nr:hypothetical protein L484_016794 [Morus notabilis]